MMDATNDATISPEPSGTGANSDPGQRTGKPVIDGVQRVWDIVFADMDDLGDFFDNGGTSLTAMKIAASIDRDMGVRISLVDVLENPSPALLAEVVRERMTEVP